MHTKKQDADRCPYFDEPMKDCYCVLFSSFTIPSIVKYCLHTNYERCPHYRGAALMSSRQEVSRGMSPKHSEQIVVHKPVT
jgi:hypothetical protein